MSTREILEKYISFFEKRGHKQVPNQPLVPREDSTLLFVNSGMFPLVPYLEGEKHPLGERLVNVQRAFRFSDDIDNVGSTNRHTTGFHMLGNWSLNDYFKEEQLNWLFEFLIEELGLNINKMYPSVFKGNEYAQKDKESIRILKNIFNKYGIDAKENERIFAYGTSENWWKRGDAVGELGGPSSEILYYIGQEGNGKGKNPINHEEEYIEICNSVFMEYKKTKEGWKKMGRHNVDFGGGLERIAMILQNKEDVFQTDLFFPVIKEVESLSSKKYKDNWKTQKAMRIISDHMRSSVMLAMDGVKPSNKDQGYVLRQLIRRLVRNGKKIGIKNNISTKLLKPTIDMLIWLYPNLEDKQEEIENIFKKEEKKFKNTLKRAEKEVEKKLSRLESKEVSEEKLAKIAFDLFQSEGYPPEMLREDLDERNIKINEKKFNDEYKNALKEHKEISRKGAEKKFKGGLADQNEETTKLHTATHLLHRSLRKVLGKHVEQKGSNINAERLRFDFNHPKALTEKELEKVEDMVNTKIEEGLPVKSVEMDKKKAKETGALYLDQVNYPNKVKVYFIGDSLEDAWSKEFCGGPHVKNTKELGKFSIIKEESSSKGIRRIRATLD